MTSWTRVLLPEPLTPETATSRRKGKEVVRFLRLWQSAPCSRSQGWPFSGQGRRVGKGMVRRPER
ncbi:MAG: hypothetical protein ABS32_06160 [Verrucomicrobia subdivision 6 bacterium BACL9 MAG-120820-bin42]|uniref:Uncharacterized protein n=1 Tax=Verrucomicrobia subdivision 6 bacterium BACL9 MAG-120820-bin42 TaxID=1655634 RepID=A0A0R2XAN4_9BACT|nr:MAG: hypothetical protein ABS32_06160 [Verrucomicrobia subdivision 6 bacterium BACL9 MAG-120820-bin42]